MANASGLEHACPGWLVHAENDIKKQMPAVVAKQGRQIQDMEGEREPRCGPLPATPLACTGLLHTGLPCCGRPACPAHLLTL